MVTKKVVIVIGGAGLLGSVICQDIAQYGNNVILADINLDEAIRLADKINLNFPGSISATSVDITKTNSIRSLIDATYRDFGKIDAVVNNAYPRNRNYGRKVEDVTYDDFCENVNSHLGGYFLVMQEFAVFFKKHKRGNIINMSSIYGLMTPRFEVYSGTEMTMPVEYAAIKSAIIHLTKYFAQYYKRDSIRVNCISPGGIFMNQPSKFIKAYKDFCGDKGMLDPKDISGAILFLLSVASEFITGQNIVIDDGYSL